MTEFLKKWKIWFTFAALLSCFVNILQLTFPFYMFSIYRNIIVSYSTVSLLNITAAAVFAVLILGAFSYLRARLLAMAGRDLNLMMRQKVYTGMIKGTVFGDARAYRSGMNDIEALRNYFSTPSIYAVFDAPWAPFYLALIYLFHPGLGFIATAGALIMVALSALQEYLVRKRLEQASAKNARNQRFVDSMMRNAEVINGMGMIPNVSDRFVLKNHDVIKNQVQSSYHAGAIQAVLKPMQNVIQVLIYCFGAYYAMTQGFDVGLMVAASIIMGRGLGPLMQLMGGWRMTVQVRGAYQRLRQFSQVTTDASNAMSLPAPQGQLSVIGASFMADKRMLLRGISFSLEQGEFAGIIGPSGAGKTTLCRLLLGIWPALGGKVYLDGRDIFAWDKKEIGRYIGYLPQEIELFPGTVAENIARLGDIDRDALETAMQISGITEMVAGFPQGIHTLLEGEGVTLSGGQKQKIGLARAIYGSPKLLILDEPTSNLDEQGEHVLMGALSYLKQVSGCTCLMVTHKPQLLESMDKILVIRDGAVAMFGPRQDVFARLSGQQHSQPSLPGQAAI